MARKRGIGRADVAGAATAIADESGLDGVTLAAVADRLGIRPPSLYAHVDGLAGLRRLLAFEAATAMTAAFERVTAGRRGLDALRVLAHEYRRFAQVHPGLYEAGQRAARPDEDAELYAALGGAAAPALRALGEAGVPSGERVHLTRAVRSALHGFVELERGGGFGMPESVDESFTRVVSLLTAAVEAAVNTDGGHAGDGHAAS